MIVFRGLEAAQSHPPHAGGRVATVGYFDGIHIGHQKLLSDLKAWALELGFEPAVITFDRHPQEVLSGAKPLRILSLEHRLLLLAREGLSAVLLLPFDRALAAWSASELVERAIRGALRSRHLFMGFDSAFGRNREGTFKFLSQHADSLGIAVRQGEPKSLDGERVSSTLVRTALREGDFPRLEQLLGRRFSILGKAREGDGRGKSLGFPTANLDVLGAALPPPGVYFAEASILGASLDEACSAGAAAAAKERLFGAVVNIGRRPTFHDPSAAELTLEAHLLGFTGDLYGQYLEARFLKRHRDEMKFPSAAALVDQIRSDVQAFRVFRGG